MFRNRREIKLVIYVAAIFTIFQIGYHFISHHDIRENKIVQEFQKSFLNSDRAESKNEWNGGESNKISYENVKFRELEARRKGPGENAEPFNLTDPIEIEENAKWYKSEGFYVLVSDKISVDRAIPDNRPKACRTRKYLPNLPSASVVITFHNEILSVLLRTVHAIFNRSPPELLHEIVLIDDGSTFENLGATLENYIQQSFFDGKIKLHRNGKREGLIRGRMIGARLATGEILVFLDSHMEVDFGWLHPLIEPIAINSTYATVPHVEGIHHATFVPGHGGYGDRGHFDWSLTYKWYGPHKDEHPELGEDFDLPCMTGGSYAIGRKHFFFLEGYDEDMDMWNGENYELSFKLWLCSGRMLRVPCSRVHHLSKMWSAHREMKDKSDFVGKNLKRVVEVWFDDYKKYFYGYDEERYAKVDAGDLTKQFAFKERLKCKPFQYYLDHVATRLIELYPLTPRFKFGGNLQNNNKLCFGLSKMNFHKTAVLLPCSDDPTKPDEGTNFVLTIDNEIRYNTYQSKCLDAVDLAFYGCHKNGGNQGWIYNPANGQIKVSNANKCLTGHGVNQHLSLDECSDSAENQRWSWAVKNDLP